jgi:hypothetical protein
MARPFHSPRPSEYPEVPAAIRSRRGIDNLPPGPRGFPGQLTIKFISNTPTLAFAAFSQPSLAKPPEMNYG